MEFKFRQKGEVKTIDLTIAEYRIENKPVDLDGVDLTGYSVIYARFGKRGHDKAQSLHEKASNVIVLYSFEWYNGWGEGIILPDNFNPSRLKFYKSAKQVADMEEAIRLVSFDALLEEIKEALPDYSVVSDVGNVEIMIKPKQETHSCDNNWYIRATSMEEAISGIKEKQPFWKEWNERSVEAYCRLTGKSKPGRNGIYLYPSPSSDCKTVGIELNHNSSLWARFYQQDDGTWTVEGDYRMAPSECF